jgi:hypothetical protein
MIDLDTPFHKRIAKLRAPTSAAFEPEAWAALLDGGETRTDLTLIAAATMIAAESAAFRDIPPDSHLAALDAGTETAVCVAALNVEFLTVVRLSNQTVKGAIDDGAISYGHLVSKPFASGTGQSVSAEGVVDASVDAAESWLFDIKGQKQPFGDPPDDLADLTTRTVGRYSMQRGLNTLWNQCLWEGWRPVPAKGGLSWGPQDLETATLLEASKTRQAENFMNFPHIDRSVWIQMTQQERQGRALPRTVVEAVTKPRRRVRVGTPPCRSRTAPPFVIERAGLEGSYLEVFLDRELPYLPGLNCRDLLAAWHVLLDFAELLAKEAASGHTLTGKDARRLALQTSSVELRRILCEALAFESHRVDAIIDVLTFRPKVKGKDDYRGLWTAPIVPVPGEPALLLVLPVLAVSNPLRKVEMWLQKGGLDDNLSKDSRGDSYEAEYRSSTIAAIKRNPLFSDVRCAEREIKSDEDFSEQIDLLVRLGDLLIVGEVKCWLYPAESNERFRHFRKLKGAAEQAVRKAEAIRVRPDVAARALGLDPEECKRLRVVPIVVANQGFGFSLDIGGCRIADAAFLELFFGTGSPNSGAAFDNRTGRMMSTSLTLYESEKQAADKFESILARPVVLYRFADRIEWTTTPFPSLIGANTTVAMFHLKDVTGDERMICQMLASA